MGEVAWRLVLVGGIAAAAAAAGYGANRLRARRAASAPVDVSGLAGRLLLFTEHYCASCTAVRSMLEEAGAGFEEIRYEESPEMHRRAGVASVPLLVARDAGGVVTGRIAGRASKRALRRLLEAAGIE
jgi:hypothetical protein